MTNQMNIFVVMRVVALFVLCVLMIGCASTQALNQTQIPAKRPIDEYVNKDIKHAIDAYDPWEGMNRRIYKFNALFDRYVFLPVVNAYRFITPDIIETGVSNFFNNLHEIKHLTNSLLQLSLKNLGLPCQGY
jgi:phospholipid-binding lipoprotein MlaA